MNTQAGVYFLFFGCLVAYPIPSSHVSADIRLHMLLIIFRNSSIALHHSRTIRVILSQAIDIPHAIYTALARRFHPGSPLRQDWQSRISMTISTYYVLAQCFNTLIFLTTRVIVHVPTAIQIHAFLKVLRHLCMIS